MFINFMTDLPTASLFWARHQAGVVWEKLQQNIERKMPQLIATHHMAWCSSNRFKLAVRRKRNKHQKNKAKQNKNRAATKPTTKPNKEPRLKIIMGGVPIIHVVGSVNEEFSTLMTKGRRIRLCQVCPQLFWDWILPFKDDVKQITGGYERWQTG